jgi:hypothetical protein
MELGLPEGIIKRQTVLSRLQRNNLNGIAHQKVLPLSAMEPLLVEWCIKMAKIGQALTKENVIGLATELIEGTEHADKLEAFKKKRKLRTKDDAGEKTILGDRWYEGFMKRNHEALKRGRCKVKDQKRRTWCTYEKVCMRPWLKLVLQSNMMRRKCLISTETL